MPLTKERVKEMLEKKGIVRVDFTPYLSITFDDNTEIEVVPEQISEGGVTYLDISFKERLDDSP